MTRKSRQADVQPDLAESADRVRACYVFERRRWESLRSGRQVDYRPPRVYSGAPAVTVDGELVLAKARRSEWQSLAEWFAERGWHPESYIRLQFEYLPTNVARALEPKDLKSQECQRIWSQFSQRNYAKVKVALDVQMSIAARIFQYEKADGATDEEAMLEACASGESGLSPLFRYCLAAKQSGEAFRKPKNNYEAAAVVQYLRDQDAYREIWRDALPPGFDSLITSKYGTLARSVK